MIKICPMCEKEKPKKDFYARSAKCKLCERILHDKRYIENKEERKLQKKEYDKKNSEKNRYYRINKLYGLKAEQYNEMLVSQKGCCAICGTNTPGGNSNFHVDHDHVTGQVRALLCGKCNRGLGLFNDSIENLKIAAKYLESFI